MRGSNRHIWVTDGHSEDVIKYAANMAAFPGTLVFYMGAGRTREIAQILLANGIDESKPCVLVENAGSARRKLNRGSVADAAAGFIKRTTEGPGIFLVGEVLKNTNNAVESENAFAFKL
jgi:siroheme synthase